jgi:excisionase family DNA binding protein
MTRLELVPLVQAGEVGRGLSWPGWLHTFEVERAKGRYPDLIGPVDISDEAIGQTPELRSAKGKSEPPNVVAAIPVPKSTTVSRRVGRTAERITVERASGILGLGIRTVQKMAQRGELAGAAKIGRRWTFNEDKLRGYVRNKEREIWQAQRHRQDATGVKTFSGAAQRSKAAKSDGRFAQAIQKLRHNAEQRGKSGR